jgi:DeoR family transcriptional regulator, aga operon transcriptional repressor
MFGNVQRKHRLNDVLSAIVESDGIAVATLSERLGISAATVRRDLELLEKQRLVTRYRGGARPHPSFNDLPLTFKASQDAAEKARIARGALAFLDGARVIGTTGGTTVTELARLLLDRNGLTIVTNAVNLATTLAANPWLRVYCAGGQVRSSSHEAVGAAAEEFMGRYNVDIAFLGVDGVHPEEGCTTYDAVGARVNAVLQTRARRTIVLADATKIGRVGLAQVCPMSAVDVLITDARAPAPVLEAIRSQGCQVVVV